MVGTWEPDVERAIAHVRKALAAWGHPVGTLTGSVDVDSVTHYQPAARTIARTPARIASGRFGQAWMIGARAGSMPGFLGVSAPDFAPPGAELV